MKDGIINVYKPKGMTSNDVIYKVRAALGIRKLGHTGTLDPMAEGVLPIMINRGTRIAEYLDWDLKTYETTVTLGIRTDSLDVTGEITETSDPSGIAEEDVRRAFRELLPNVEETEGGAARHYGILDQMPPRTSAVRIEGRRLYEYVHAGEEIPEDILKKVRPRKVWIDSLTIDEIDLPDIRFTVRCSKGTYIRSISRDIGEILGTGAVMKSLKRTSSGAFDLTNSVSVDEILKTAIKAGRVCVEAGGPAKTDSSARSEAGDSEPIEDPGQVVTSAKIKRKTPFGDVIPVDMERFILGPDLPLVNLGEALVSHEDALRLLDGWHLSYREAKVTKEPEKPAWIDLLGEEAETYDRTETSINIGSHAGLKLHPEYMKTYKVYETDGRGGRVFVGIARHSDKYHKLTPIKIFITK